jgi:hypothetical protein
MHGRVDLCPYENWAFLWINVAENINCPKTPDESLHAFFIHDVKKWIQFA